MTFAVCFHILNVSFYLLQELPVQLCMLSAISSQQEFSDDLQSFTGSATKTVLIIVSRITYDMCYFGLPLAA